MLEVARAILTDDKAFLIHDDAGIWMVQNYGLEVLDDIIAYLHRTARPTVQRDHYNRSRVTSAAVKTLGAGALPAVLAAIRTRETQSRLEALSHLVSLDDGGHEELIHSELVRGLAEPGKLKARVTARSPRMDSSTRSTSPLAGSRRQWRTGCGNSWATR